MGTFSERLRAGTPSFATFASSAVKVVAVAVAVAVASPAAAQSRAAYSHADSLRGSNGPWRSWWDVSFYDLHVKVNPVDSTIAGWNGISYRVTQSGSDAVAAAKAPALLMQIDLQLPMVVDSIIQGGRALKWTRDSNAVFVTMPAAPRVGEQGTVAVYYHGKPAAAKRPPWDGGYIWRRDTLGNRWVATANEGLGASVWWPNKDYLADEPDSQRVAITVPDPMVDVSNGRLRSTTKNADGTTTFEWFVAEPINNYDVSVNAGTYAQWTEIYAGEAGALSMDFWPLAVHLDAAKRQWPQARSMMACFEHWFGPYPWYKDGYKLVEAPHLGMEHQSAVAYGNGFQNGYLGRDLSKTGHGMQWDFIIVHESAHEWWGNNITVKDGADMWVHEGFANYSENLYTECQTGDKKAGAEYVIGTRVLVRNDGPVIGTYGVNDEGSGDRYYKGGNMLHTIRQIVNDDERWRMVLRGLNSTFRHQTVTTAQIETYISEQTGVSLGKVFDQYLRSTKIPSLELSLTGGSLSYRWANVVPGFDMPVRVTLPGKGTVLLHPTATVKTEATTASVLDQVVVDENFYITVKKG